MPYDVITILFKIYYLLNLFIIEKEKVNEQVVTHWFQNKRKSLRKCNILSLKILLIAF